MQAARCRCLVSLTVMLVATACGVGPPSGPPPPSSPSSGPTASAVAQTPTASGSASQVDPTPEPPGLKGDRRNALAFAPLDDPGSITVEGRVPMSPAWSTSKVLVVAAFLDTTAGGDPERVSAPNRRMVTAALTRSDADAVRRLRGQIVGRPALTLFSTYIHECMFWA